MTTRLAEIAGGDITDFPSLDTVGSCEQGWEPQCANEIDCEQGGIVNITIGEDINQLPNHDGSIVNCATCTTPYLYPTDIYDWKVIALNSENGIDGTNCPG